MKKLTSENPITFRADGLTVLEINSEGCLAQDFAAKMVEERLGGVVTIEDAGIDKSADEMAADAAGDETKDVDSPSLADLKARAKELGLKVGGSKDELISRIEEEESRLAADVPVEG